MPKKKTPVPTETNKTNNYKKALLEALEKSLGIVSNACKAVGVNRSTFYDYYNNDPDFKASVDGVREVVLDFAESKLYKLIQDENPAAVFFYLKCHGKKRGYVERLEINQKTNITNAPKTMLEFFDTPETENENENK